MRRLSLSLAVALFAAWCTAAETPRSAPWNITGIATSDTHQHAKARTGDSPGPQKYLHLDLTFDSTIVDHRVDKFRVVDRQGKTIGEVFGETQPRDPKSTVVFERDVPWSSLEGLYLDGLGQRVPLFSTKPAAPPPAAIVRQPAPLPAQVVQPTIVEEPRTVYVPSTPDRVVGGASLPDQVIVRQPEPVVVHHDREVDVHVDGVGGGHVHVGGGGGIGVVGPGGGGGVGIGGGGGLGVGGGGAGVGGAPGGCPYGDACPICGSGANAEGKTQSLDPWVFDSFGRGRYDDLLARIEKSAADMDLGGLTTAPAAGSGSGIGNGPGAGRGAGAGRGPVGGSAASAGIGEGDGLGIAQGGGPLPGMAGGAGAAPRLPGMGAGAPGSPGDASKNSSAAAGSPGAAPGAPGTAPGSPGAAPGSPGAAPGAAGSGSGPGSPAPAPGGDGSAQSAAPGQGSGEGAGPKPDDGFGPGPEDGYCPGPEENSAAPGQGGPGTGPGGPGPGAPAPGQMAAPAERAPGEVPPSEQPPSENYPTNLDNPASANANGPGSGGGGAGVIGPDNVIGPRYQNLANGPRVRVHDIGPEWLRRLPERTGPVIDVYRPVIPYFDPRFRFDPRIGQINYGGYGYGGGGGGGGGVGYGAGGSYGDLASTGAPLKFEKLPELLPEIVLYVSAGNDGEEGGKIYQLDDAGRVLGIVKLPYHATGLALHRQHGLIAVTPRDGGKIYRIDETGKVSLVLENNSRLPHPVDVGVGGDSDTIVVADNMADVLAATSIAGTEPIIYRRFENAKYEQQDMSVAVTRDKHVMYGTDAEDGIYRFGGDDYTAFRGPILPGRGGVAADPATLKWAATQSPNLIHLYEGELPLKTFKLAAGKYIYRQGLLSFAPSGAIVVATRPSDEVDTGVWLTAYETAEGKEGQILSLFPWDKERMLDFVVGPRMLWDRHSPSTSKSVY